MALPNDLSSLDNHFTLVVDGQLDALSLGKRDLELLGGTDDENVLLTGGESVASGVTHGSNVERTGVLLDMDNGTHTTCVATLGDHGNLALLEVNEIDDLAGGVLFLMELEDPPDWVNLGTGVDHSIQEIAELVKSTVGFEGSIENDTSRPDGMPVKCLDVSLVNSLGWKSETRLEDGISSAYQDFLSGLETGVTRLH